MSAVLAAPPTPALHDPVWAAKVRRAQLQSRDAQMAVAVIHPPPRDPRHDMLRAMGRFIQRYGWGALGFQRR